MCEENAVHQYMFIRNPVWSYIDQLSTLALVGQLLYIVRIH